MLFFDDLSQTFPYQSVCVVCPGPSNRSNSVSSLDLEGESVSELGAGPSGSNGVEALQLLEHEQGVEPVFKYCLIRRYTCEGLVSHEASNIFQQQLRTTWTTNSASLRSET